MVSLNEFDMAEKFNFFERRVMQNICNEVKSQNLIEATRHIKVSMCLICEAA